MNALMRRRDLMRELLKHREGAFVISSLGSSTYDVAAAGDTPANFYFWGAMGGAAAMGLGLALAQPGLRVVVVSGDGEMLMGLTTLATIAAQQPANLGILVLDNQAFAETGAQTGLTAYGLNVAAVATACGFPATLSVDGIEQAAEAGRLLFRQRGPALVRARIGLTEDKRVLPERDGPVLARRSRRFVLGGREAGE